MAALLVSLRPFINRKTHVRIKTDSERILLVDRQFVYGIGINGILKQIFADAFPSVRGRNK